MVVVSLACTGPIFKALGKCLRDVSLAEVTFSKEQWMSFLRNMAIHTCIEELVLCKASNLTGKALGHFVRHLPPHTKFQALGLRHMTRFVYQDLGRVLEKNRLHGLKMRK